MGLLDIFKSKKIIDELFGELIYTKFKDPLNNFYEGIADFHDKKMGVVIDSDETGPTQMQKEFFCKFRDNYLTIKTEIIIPFLNEKFKQDFNEDCQIVDFDKEFDFDGMTIPRLPQNPVIWKLCYDSIKLKHSVTINFSDYEPTDILVEG